MRNYHPAFVEGTSNVRASSFKDHDRHAYAFCMGTGGIGRSKFKLDRTNLALYWQSTSTIVTDVLLYTSETVGRALFIHMSLVKLYTAQYPADTSSA